MHISLILALAMVPYVIGSDSVISSCRDSDLQVIDLRPGTSYRLASDGYTAGKDCTRAFKVRQGTRVSFTCHHLVIGASKMIYDASFSKQQQTTYSGRQDLITKVTPSQNAPYLLDINFSPVEDSTEGGFDCTLNGEARTFKIVRTTAESAESPVAVASKAAKVQCGQANPASFSEFPWQVVVVANDAIYGGTIINRRWVLTTNKNFDYDYDYVDLDPYDDWLVVVGVNRLTEDIQTSEIIRVKRVVSHPLHQPNLLLAYDFALLEMETPFTWSEAIKPVCLPQDSSRDYADVIATMSGWAIDNYLNETETGHEVLRMRKTQVHPRGVCRSRFNDADVIPELQFCANNTDLTFGAKGGPLVMQEGNGLYTLIGVTTSSDQSESAVVYGRVTKILTWIRETSGSSSLNFSCLFLFIVLAFTFMSNSM